MPLSKTIFKRTWRVVGCKCLQTSAASLGPAGSGCKGLQTSFSRLSSSGNHYVKQLLSLPPPAFNEGSGKFTFGSHEVENTDSQPPLPWRSPPCHFEQGGFIGRDRPHLTFARNFSLSNLHSLVTSFSHLALAAYHWPYTYLE